MNTILITGATSGIGRATAYRFAPHVKRMILTGRRADRLDAISSDLMKDHSLEVKTLPFDVRDYESCRAALESLPQDWRSIDILVNNAGKAKGLAPIQSGELRHWEEMIDTNLKGLLYVTRLVSPWMVERKSGHIINVCSIAGKEVYPNGNVYCATKFAVDALTKGMRFDLHKHRIRVGQVCPSHVEETEFALVRFDGDEELAKMYEDFQPLKSPDIAETIYFIASQPPHVNIEDVVMWGTQQASAIVTDRSGRDFFGD